MTNLRHVPTRVVLPVSNNEGYAADQISAGISLGDLVMVLEAAIEQFGEDALLVTHDASNRYGANFGSIALDEDDLMEPLREATSDDDEEE